MLYLIVWVGLALIVGAIGKDKTIGFAGGFFLSILLSPLIGFIIVIASKDNKPVVTTKTLIRCDGCRKEIQGDYIRITPKGMKEFFDYCSKDCRNTYHPNYMKEKGIEWQPPVEVEEKDSE